MGASTNHQAGGLGEKIFSQFALAEKDPNYRTGIEMQQAKDLGFDPMGNEEKMHSLGWILLEMEPETRILVQVLYLRDDPTKH